MSYKNNKAKPDSLFTPLLFLLASCLLSINASFADTELSISRAYWDAEDKKLRIRGSGVRESNLEVIISDAASNNQLGSTRTEDNGSWSIKIEKPTVVPCRVRADSGGMTAERDVRNAPADCSSGGPTVAAGYSILAVNDLGMHCADLDYQVFSILPPFNVLHAQVIRK
ncbi:MAG: hypothetical protein OEY43_06260, partial [Gammaproteobacteria bacterium]|nr:hypothetical protein [Gammaproteobacteria bacterium]